jgi:hypothetical protein
MKQNGKKAQKKRKKRERVEEVKKKSSPLQVQCSVKGDF